MGPLPWKTVSIPLQHFVLDLWKLGQISGKVWHFSNIDLRG